MRNGIFSHVPLGVYRGAWRLRPYGRHYGLPMACRTTCSVGLCHAGMFLLQHYTGDMRRVYEEGI